MGGLAMTMDRRWASLITLSAALLLSVPGLVGCASDKGPAEAAIAAAEQAVGSTMAEASTYVPAQAKSLQVTLVAAKDKFAKGDYAAALGEAKSLTDRTKEIASIAAAKKAELTNTWESMSSGLPRVMDAIKSRVDILSNSKKLPSNMTADKLAAAKSGLGDMTEQWTAATAAFNGGNLPDAITKGTAVKTKAAEVLTTLGMPVPEALQG
jgi:hypothetical protein